MSTSSWFSLFLPNPPNSDDDNSPPHSPTTTTTTTTTAGKPDFSLITQTIGRQLHNVASFLAPPPQPQPSSSSIPPAPPQSENSGDVSNSSSYKGIKNDLAEIGGSLKSGISLISSKLASNLLQFDDKDDVEGVVGINDDVVEFVGQISVRPQSWIEFPLSLHNKDFNMSQVQNDHSSAIQQLVPNLTTLRHTIHNYMNEQQFWMIYFILLLPRLNEDDYKLLSTPEIVQMRELLLQKLRNKKNTPTGSAEDTPNENRSSSKKGSLVINTKRIENPLHQAIESSRETAKATNRIKNENQEYHDDDDDDVSFSDVEDEDNRLSGKKQAQSSRVSSGSETSDWVRLNETGCEQKVNPRSTYRERRSESEESSDWHAVEDVDLS